MKLMMFAALAVAVATPVLAQTAPATDPAMAQPAPAADPAATPAPAADPAMTPAPAAATPAANESAATPAAAPMPATGTYPRCSKTVTDQCTEGGSSKRTHHKR